MSEVSGAPALQDGLSSAAPIEPVPVSTKGFNPSRICGEYKDHRGTIWFCVQRTGTETIVCHSPTHMTAANPATFSAWGWVPHREGKGD